MRVLVAGATGVIGRAVVPLLSQSGHEVIGLARTVPAAVDADIEWAEVDALHTAAVRSVIERAEPEVVVNLLSSIPSRLDPRRFAEQMEATNRLRTLATKNLRSAARPGTHFVTASVAFLYDPSGGSPADESRPLWRNGPKAIREVVRAIDVAERETLDAGGAVLRLGHLYGKGTHFAVDGDFVDQVARRRVPLVGRGESIFSFVHVADVASAIERAVQLRAGGRYNVVDDDPAPIRVWLPEVARHLGARSPSRVPTLIGRMMGGSWGEAFMTSLVGATNLSARAELGWRPAHHSWRTGLLAELDAARRPAADAPGTGAGDISSDAA